MMSEENSNVSSVCTKAMEEIPLPMVDLEQSISKLLMTTKRLLEILKAWSAGTAKDTQVYDEYNALEIHFAHATQAFESAFLPMTDMLYLPDRLHECLKTTLSKEACSATLEQHLPAIRDTIIKLLQGLKRKEFMLRERYEPHNPSTNSSDLKLLSRSASQSSSMMVPLPSPSSSTEPLRAQQQLRSSSPISPAIREEFDMNDPNTQDAMNALTRQENLARRSYVRRTSHPHPSFTLDTVGKVQAPDTIDIYLRKGDQVKKISIYHAVADIKMEQIRQLFRDQFSVSQNQEFEIYILDPASNVEYELEKLTDIKTYSILSLKVTETQTHHHMPTDDVVNEMRSLFEGAMQQVLRQLEKKQCTDNILPQEKIKEQQKELESLRHDVACIHQLYNDFKKETDQLVKELREKSRTIDTTTAPIVVVSDKQAHAEMDESRQVTGKAATLITSRLEALQDSIDQLKLDVTQRRCRPSKAQLSQCQEESDRLKLEMNDLQARLKQFKPTWKKTWEVELQQIVKEQQFLKEQEDLLIDLRDDHQAVLDVLDQLVKISEIQERKKQQLGVEYRRMTASQAAAAEADDEEFQGMTSVMKQVSNIHVDHAQRIKALEKAESKRSKELSQRIDAFERELTDFVGLRKLKKTGGAQAIDKQRQQKDETMRKRIFVKHPSVVVVTDPAGEDNTFTTPPMTPIQEEEQALASSSSSSSSSVAASAASAASAAASAAASTSSLPSISTTTEKTSPSPSKESGRMELFGSNQKTPM